MSTHLIIPDPHSKPGTDNTRFTLLGKLIVDLKPDYVICLGDWADMPSLMNKAKLDPNDKMQGIPDYMQDVFCARDAQELMFAPIKRAKRRLPKFFMLEGNHEYRIFKAVAENKGLLKGVISIDDLQYREHGWEVVPYNGSTPGILVLDGVAYAHYFTSGVMGNPITSLNPAYTLLQKHYMSCTQGHIHTTDYCIRGTPVGTHIHGLVGGCFVDYLPAYSGNNNNLWWRGVIVKYNVNDGSYDPEWISLERLTHEYTV